MLTFSLLGETWLSSAALAHKRFSWRYRAGEGWFCSPLRSCGVPAERPLVGRRWLTEGRGAADPTPAAHFMEALSAHKALMRQAREPHRAPRAGVQRRLQLFEEAGRCSLQNGRHQGRVGRMPCAPPLRGTCYAVWIFSWFPSCTFNLWERSSCVLENFMGTLTSRNLFSLRHGFRNFIKFLKSRGCASTGRGTALMLTVISPRFIFQDWKYLTFLSRCLSKDISLEKSQMHIMKI